ncbi:MAG: hypothetical protein JF603_09845 [Acidobacteria bacterium]|nr:hypothetical protein [Acidobacteriota bacterium]
MIRLDAATVLLQWATGGLFFLWVTSRRREVGIGYGWLLRGTYGLSALGAVAVASVMGWVPVREVASAGVVAAASAAFVVSVVRRRAGVRGQQELVAARSARVAAMTGIERDAQAKDEHGAEFPPWLDLVAPAIGAIGLVAAALDAGGNHWLALLRTVAGAAFLGAVTDAMLLGHWYLVQPGLTRAPLLELVRATAVVWPIEVIALLLPTGMVSVWSGSVDDGYNGLLGWFWAACAVGTIVLCAVTRAALKERYYSAVMAATGLLYLAILTAFGTDLVARAVLAG